MTVLVKDGVLWQIHKNGKKTTVQMNEADSIAQANGYCYAEQFVKRFDGQTLILNKELERVD